MIHSVDEHPTLAIETIGFLIDIDQEQQILH